MRFRFATAARPGGLSVLLSALAAGLVAASATGPAAAEITQQDIAVSNFTGIRLDGAMDVTIRQGGRFSVVASGTPAALARLKTEVSGGELSLNQKGMFLGNGDKLTVAITMPRLQSVKVNGSGDVKLDGMKLGRVSLAVSGAGDITATGSCDELEASVSGAGDILARNLKCRTVSARVSGAGDIAAHASLRAHATVSGVGDIDIYGNPKEREDKRSGIGDVTYHRAL